ncbi:hypothetical protein CH300_14765 [Rhodococcus sp. 15-1154-1]|nr:hypothetical protein [Rhodococcus sp. 15-1154-1]OZF04655.1 hypothetical protein CH300_14765 [Rhodococcus sp. 15-1154-1]
MSENNTDPEDTGQISVAELLARNGQKSTSSSTGGRRRRGVKGGISVAELTGEIPVVRAEPASDEAPVIATDSKQVPAQAPAPVRTRETDEPEPELLSGSTTAAGDLMNRAHDEADERRPYGSTASQRPVPAAGRRTPDETSRSTSGRQTTGFVARPRPSRPEPSAATPADAEPKTDVTPKPVVPPKAAGPAVTSTPAATSNPATRAFARRDDADEKALAEEETTQTPDLVKKVAALADTEDAPAEDSTAENSTVADRDASAESVEETDESQPRAEKKDAAKQWLGLAGQGVVAVVVGALLFKGFERLWDVLPWVALVLAVLVIVGLVAVVRILRRTDDLVSMVIAVVVGVFVTLGPLAFQLSTG